MYACLYSLLKDLLTVLCLYKALLSHVNEVYELGKFRSGGPG